MAKLYEMARCANMFAFLLLQFAEARSLHRASKQVAATGQLLCNGKPVLNAVASLVAYTSGHGKHLSSRIGAKHHPMTLWCLAICACNVLDFFLQWTEHKLNWVWCNLVQFSHLNVQSNTAFISSSSTRLVRRR